MSLTQDDPGTMAMTTVAGYLAQRSNVCAKVIDRDGAIFTINQRGLAPAESSASDVCGQVWTEFWEGEDRASAAAAVEIGFAGKACEFIGTFRTGGIRSAWEVEILPLVWDGDTVQSLLVLSTRIGAPLDSEPVAAAHPDVGALRGLGEAFRALTAAAHLSTEVAGQLRGGLDGGGLDGGETRALADRLEATGRRAEQAVEDLAALLQVNPRTVV